MPEFKYAKGRLVDSVRFISEEMKEFKEEYAEKYFRGKIKAKDRNQGFRFLKPFSNLNLD